MLIRLLDITDTSHGAPYNILLVTQKQSAKKTESAQGERTDGRRKARRDGEKKDAETSGLES